MWPHTVGSGAAVSGEMSLARLRGRAGCMYTLGGRPRAGDTGLDGQVTGRGGKLPLYEQEHGPGSGRESGEV